MNTNPIYTLRAAMRLMRLFLFVRHLLMFTTLLFRRLAAAMARCWRDTDPTTASSDASECCSQPMADDDSERCRQSAEESNEPQRPATPSDQPASLQPEERPTARQPASLQPEEGPTAGQPPVQFAAQRPETSLDQPGKKAAHPAPDRMRSDRAAMVRFNEAFLRQHYDLRYNVLTQQTELRERDSDADWRPLDERELNQLTVEQLKAGGSSWSYAMRLCIERPAVPLHHPVRHWLQQLPAWDGRDRIDALAARVPTDYADWPRYFHRWLLALTAQALGMGHGYGNSVVPMLIGAQGTHKTTFCRMLLPRELRQYFMDDIKMDSAEQVERVLCRMLLVNIDEYNAKTPREQAKIKRLLTEHDVQMRRPRSAAYTLTPRLCSFIATTNDPTPLPSGDGTRRYLCVSVSGQIDTTDGLDHCQLYAQLLHELRQDGALWWFTAADEAAIQQHNQQYVQLSAAEQVLPQLLMPSTERRREHLMTVGDVQRLMATRLRPADIPPLRAIATAMKALGWPQGAIHGTRGYYLVPRQQEA